MIIEEKCIEVKGGITTNIVNYLKDMRNICIQYNYVIWYSLFINSS